MKRTLESATENNEKKKPTSERDKRLLELKGERGCSEVYSYGQFFGSKSPQGKVSRQRVLLHKVIGGEPLKSEAKGRTDGKSENTRPLLQGGVLV